MDPSGEDVFISNIKQYIDCFKIEIIADGVQKYVCNVNSCRKEYCDKSGAIRHLKNHHNELYSAVRCNKTSGPTETNLLNPEVEIRVKVKPDDIWDACVDLITANALPLSIVESSAFQKILKPYVTALKLKGIDLIINRHNIKDRIAERAEKIRELLRRETKNKVLSLMLDIATRYNRSVLGINIGFMNDGKIQIRTIGMLVLNFSHTAANIVELIRETLAAFGIRLSQIISVTTDNGKNMVKAIALLDSSYQQIRNEMFPENDLENDEHIDGDVFDEEYYTDLLSRVRSMFETTEYTDLVNGISCGIHCLHLVVTKGINSSTDTKNLVARSRELVKLLRTPTFHSKLVEAKLKQAVIDVETRWNSIFAMVCFIFFLFFTQQKVSMIYVSLSDRTLDFFEGLLYRTCGK